MNQTVKIFNCAVCDRPIAWVRGVTGGRHVDADTLGGQYQVSHRCKRSDRKF